MSRAVRYVATARPPRGWATEDIDQGLQSSPSIDVFERSPEAVDTGLLDQFGVRVYRLNVRDPIGFMRKAAP